MAANVLPIWVGVVFGVRYYPPRKTPKRRRDAECNHYPYAYLYWLLAAAFIIFILFNNLIFIVFWIYINTVILVIHILNPLYFSIYQINHHNYLNHIQNPYILLILYNLVLHYYTYIPIHQDL